jgi:hypothetical protein
MNLSRKASIALGVLIVAAIPPAVLMLVVWLGGVP